MTLFVYQIFISIVTNGNDLFGLDLTGGVNGIANLDPFDLFGREIVVAKQGIFNSNYVYIALGVFLVVFGALYLVNNSRIGRAWRALREDTLAAELMGMPTDWLKLLAFAFGAAVAALTGGLFASLKVGVFPETFSLTLLITVYAMLILGGVGSQTGAVLGAVVVYVFLEALRDPDVSGWVFYVAALLALVLVVRPRWMIAVVLAATLAFGFAVHAIAGAIDESWTTTASAEADAVTRFLDAWVVIPTAPGDSKTFAYIGLVALILLATTVKGIWRWAVLVPDALPRCLRVGERDVAAARRHALRAARRSARRRHGHETVRDPGRTARGDRLMAALLELQGVSMAFGGLTCVDNLDLHVDEDEIVSVIGPNGAGKTTLFNLVTGVYEPTGGDIVFEGESIKGVSPHRITQRGIARTFQTLRLFLNMSVRENVMAAAYGHTKAGVFRSMLRTPGMRREEREIRELAEKRLAFFGDRLMGYRWDQPAYSLSYANRRRLEIARATATNPRLLLLDEPAAGMNPKETQEITELIGQLRTEGGYTILVIEHDMHVVEGISDRVVALDHGVKIAEGTFEQVATNPRVVEAYLGTGAAERK